MMTTPPHSETMVIKKGTWSPEEDRRLVAYIKKYGIWNWSRMPKAAGLSRSGKSCRLRWMNYLRPDLKHGKFTEEEQETILRLYDMLGSKWSEIAKRLPGRTDNEVKNFFNTHLRKKCGLKNEAVKATDQELQGTQTPRVSTEFEEWNLSKNNQLCPLLVSPREASSSGKSSYMGNFSIMSPQLHANTFSSLTSSLSDIVNGEVNNNQFLVEKNNGLILQSCGELQSWWEELGQPFPTETLYHNVHQAALYTNDGQSLIEEFSMIHPYDSHNEDSNPFENNLSSPLPPTTSNSTTEAYERIPSQQSPGLLLADIMSSPTSFLEYNRSQTVQTIVETVGCSSLDNGTNKVQPTVDNLGSFDSWDGFPSWGGQPISLDDSHRPLTHRADHKSFGEVIFPDDHYHQGWQ